MKSKVKAIEEEKINICDKKSVEKIGITCILFSIISAVIYYFHISYMHEKHVMFSYLSTIEREMFFRTENGFYYSFYKQLITADGIKSAYKILMKDNLTEYPSEVRAVERFNLYPEIVLAVLYRTYVWLASEVFNVRIRWCYMVSREGLPSVTNCEGMGEPAIFYVNLILFLHAAVLIVVLVLIGCVLARYDVRAGVVVFLMFMFNHRECTRVQWSAPLRENFSYPFLMLQQLLVVAFLNKKSSDKITFPLKIALTLSTLFAMLSWQFAQFALFTQCVSIFMAFLIKSCGSELSENRKNSWNQQKAIVRQIYICLFYADVFNLILQFGNALLLTGPFRPCYLTCLFLIQFEPWIVVEKFQQSILAPLRWVLLTIIMLSSTLGIKYIFSYVLNIDSDNHMFDILKSKFSNFKSFDSLMYTCAPEFDFYDVSSFKFLSKTGVLPLGGIVMVSVVLVTIATWLYERPLIRSTNRSVSENSKTSSNGDGVRSNIPNKNMINENLAIDNWNDDWKCYRDFFDLKLYYTFFQTVAYFVMAMLIMRLKLFWTPQLCILASVFFSLDFPINTLIYQKLNRIFPLHYRFPRAVIIGIFHCLLVAVCCLQGWQNLQDEWKIEGTFSNWEQEQLLNQIMSSAGPNDSFVGKMPTMATVRLVTGRPVTLHPHYEDSLARERVRLAYSVFSRKKFEEVHQILKLKLHAHYLVYEPAFCTERADDKPQCSYFKMWDLIEPENAHRTPACYLFNSALRGGKEGSRLDGKFRLNFVTEGGQYALYEIL